MPSNPKFSSDPPKLNREYRIHVGAAQGCDNANFPNKPVNSDP
jgi:hypothetical protein